MSNLVVWWAVVKPVLRGMGWGWQLLMWSRVVETPDANTRALERQERMLWLLEGRLRHMQRQLGASDGGEVLPEAVNDVLDSDFVVV